MLGLVFKGIVHPNISYFVFHRGKKVIQAWNDVRVIKWWQILNFRENDSFGWTCHLLIVWNDIRETFSSFYCCKPLMKRNLIHRFSVRQVVINIISLSCQLPFIRLQNEICSNHNAVSLCTKQGLQMHLSRTLSNNGRKKHHNLKIVPSSKERLMIKQDT